MANSVYGRPHRRIGLLGGSFNPGHGGHLHVSLSALRRLDLDEVWWLVSPQNPLKPATGMAPFAERLAGAEAFARGHPRIRVSAIEASLATQYTADTIAALERRFPHSRFVWLMGGDNLAQLPHWKRWVELMERVPIAVFDRPQTSLRALSGKAAQRFARARVPEAAARSLAEIRPPAWAFFHTKLDPRSATEIRKKRVRRPRKPKETAAKETATKETATVTSLPARRRKTAAAATAATLLATILASLEDGKAVDVVTIDLAGKTLIADYMVIASGRSARQVTALTDHLVEVLGKKRRVAIEGKAQGDWVLIDAGDVIVHLFRPEIRAYYNLEKMWGGTLPGTQTAAGE